MLTKLDIGELKKTFATKEDLKNVTNDLIKDFKEYVDILFEKLSEKIDKIGTKFDDQQGNINNHERKIEKLEEKVFTTTISP